MFNCQNLRTAKRKVRLLVEHVDFLGIIGISLGIFIRKDVHIDQQHEHFMDKIANLFSTRLDIES